MCPPATWDGCTAETCPQRGFLTEPEAGPLPFESLEPFIRDVLRLGAYQILYMDRVPDSAASREDQQIPQQLEQAHEQGRHIGQSGGGEDLFGRWRR